GSRCASPVSQSAWRPPCSGSLHGLPPLRIAGTVARMTPGLLALDFDGVVCDGIDEMVESSWRTLSGVTKRELPTARRAELLTRLVADRQLVYVLSTKSKPFLDALLAWQNVPLPSDRVIGRAEPKREKWDVLRGLAASHGLGTGDVWFVEDRLATLVDIRRHA